MTSHSDFVTNEQILNETMLVFGGLTQGEMEQYINMGLEQVALNLGLDRSAGVQRILNTLDVYVDMPEFMRFVLFFERMCA
jgi:hypothetical protein